MQTTEAADRSGAASQRLLHALAAATFFIFFQAFMIAPLVPALARIFSTEATVVGLAVPAYLVPYGAMTLVWGPISRAGRPPGDHPRLDGGLRRLHGGDRETP